MNYIHACMRYITVHRRAIIKNFLLGLLFLVISLAVVGFRVLYPYHLLFALPFLIVALRYKLEIFFLGANTFTKSKTYRILKKYFFRFEKFFYVLLFLGIILYIFSRVLPSDQNPFAQLTEAETETYVRESLGIAVLHIDRLEITGNALLDSHLLTKETLTADELEALHTMWEEFLMAARDSEKMTDIHRYFGQISYFRLPEAHTQSFTISYALYLKKFELFGRIIDAVDTNERVMKALNEYSPTFNGKDSYYDVRDRHVGKDTFLRRNLGRAYNWFLNATVDTNNFGEEYQALARAGLESHYYLLTHVFDTATITGQKYSSDLENSMFNSWFPIQMNVADTMGKIHVSSRTVNFITKEQIDTMRPFLRPGDIFVERRNWHVSNVGIPGFWPHAALYLGSKEDVDTYFEDIFPREGFASFSELVERQHPAFDEVYKGVDASGYPYAVIEGQAPGIILLSLEQSAMADYIGVMRPRLAKEDVLNALLRAIGNFGKPYDYNFDFETRDEIVCSELVYDAYLPTQNKKGLSFALTMTSGRNMISPNAMVEKFFNEYTLPTRELDFVYFIDGNESLTQAFVKDENAFLTSWTRSKFSTIQE